MDRVWARRPTRSEASKLRRMKRQTTNAVNSRHARIILLSREKLPNRLIAERAGCTPQWVRKIIHRFNEAGLAGIEWYPAYCGKHEGNRKFTPDIVEQIAEIALAPPKTLIGMNCWSLPKLRSYLIEQQVVASISIGRLGHVLRERGIRLRRTKTWKESQDPDFWRKYRAVRRLYTKPPKGGRVLCIDEFGPLNLQPRAGACVAGAGKRVQRHRATYHRRGGVRHMFGVYDLASDQLFGRFEEGKNGPTFLSFLRWVRRKYRHAGRLHIVLDNVAYHCTAKVLGWAKAHNVCFCYTPTNASWLNRIECHFTALRRFALDNSDFGSHAEQQEAIEDYLAWRNRQRPISKEAWKPPRSGHRRKAAA